MDGKFRISLLLILALALGARMAASVWWQGRVPAGERFVFPDSESYWSLGRSIARGEPYVFGRERAHIFRTPGYPVLLAPLFLIFGDDPPVMAARAISAVLGTISVAAVIGLTATLFDQRAALLAGFITAIEPGTISLGVFALSEAPFAPLMVLNLWAWVLAWRSPTRNQLLVHSAWGGAMAALATLMRPSWLLFLPFAVVLGLMFAKDKPKQLAMAVVMVATFSLVMSPWWVRNYRTVGRFVATTLQVGASLYDGLGPQANGSSNMDFVPGFIAEQEQSDANSSEPLVGTFEERLEKRMLTASIAWAKDNPMKCLSLAVRKFVRMWTPWPNAAEVGGFWSKLIVAVGYVPLLVLGLCGVGTFARRDWAYALVALPAVYFTLLHMVFVSSIRYREPAMLLIAVLAAGFMTHYLSNHSSPVGRRLPTNF